MTKEKVKVEVLEKWIVVTGNEKTVRFRRHSNTGIILESMLNNHGRKVSEKLLSMAIRLKEPLPALSQKELDFWSNS